MRIMLFFIFHLSKGGKYKNFICESAYYYITTHKLHIQYTTYSDICK
nr:MAG TPA: hypothetical protein [Caudoviricetes sp.]